jgi:hypothetical protein
MPSERICGEYGTPEPAEQSAAGDALQRPLRSRFRQQVSASVMCQESPRSWRLKGIGLRWSGWSQQQTLQRDAPAIILKIRARHSYSTAVTPQHIFVTGHQMMD